MAVVAEPLQQFEPAHSRQIGVDQQARGMARSKGFEKRLTARIGFDDAAVVFQHRADRLANVIVVVDEENLGAVGSSRGFIRVNRAPRGRGRRLRQKLLDRVRQLSQLDRFVELNAVVKGDLAQGLGRNVASENDEGNSAD